MLLLCKELCSFDYTELLALDGEFIVLEIQCAPLLI
jgi:hypothetical protein